MPTLALSDPHDVADLDQFLRRAAGIREGVARVIARGPMVAFFVSAAFPLTLGAPSPTFVAQRGVRLAEPAELEVVVPLAELRDRLPRLSRVGAGHPLLGVPPSRPSAPWTSTIPLRGPWQQQGTVSDDAWLAHAREVASDVQAALPTDPGRPVLFQVRDAVWGRSWEAASVEGASAGAPGAEVLAGAPFLADAYGFLVPGSQSRLWNQGSAAGGWQRLSARHGTLLWRPAGDAGALSRGR